MEINQKFFKRTALFFLSLYLSFSLTLPPIALAEIQDVVDAKETSDVFLYVGDLVTIKVGNLTRIAVANPGIVDITNASAEEITLVGRKVGETQIFIWEPAGKRQIVARVLGTDLERISQRLAALVQSAGIEGILLEKNYYEGKIVLSGYVTKNEKKKLEEITRGFNDSIIDMLIEQGDLIQIDVQFSELNTTLTKALGFDWTNSIEVEETLPSQDGSIQDLFKLGDFSRTTAILSVVSFLIQEGKARILSKPSLVVASGEEASFLVGGEIPIRTTTTSVGGGSAQENVTFKDYGVEVTVTPEIRDGKIDIDVNLTVRDVDSANAVGDDVAFLTRTAKTKVRLYDQQTIVLAGMIQRRQGETNKRVPFVSKIPVVGLLFQSKSTPTANSDQELVVSLTPRILKNLPNKNVQQSKKEESKKESLPVEGKAAVEQPKKEEAKKSTVDVPKSAVEAKVEKIVEKPKPPVATEVKKTPAQLKAEKLAADKKAKAAAAAAAKKAKADAKAAAEKAKKDKAEKAKREKEAKDKAAKEAKAKKDTKAKPVKPAVKVKEPAAKKMSAEAPLKVTAKTDEPSLDMALDDPRLKDPQNVLSDDEIAKFKDRYTKKIKSEMAETISYPYEAKASRWEGTAVLKVTILPDGNVKDVAISQSSGYAVFDKDAVNTAEILAPFDPFAPAKNMKELTVSIPVEYSEKAILGGVSP
ncbi:MAG: cell envelope integrity protein TolA [Candidatus Omnitrophica bacterium]|nr:cell envelope integrity protein TolA [Candidatus Omnitrophota bacterium]